MRGTLWLYPTVKQHSVNELHDCFLSVPFPNHFSCQHGHKNSHHRCWIYWALNFISSRSCIACCKFTTKDRGPRDITYAFWCDLWIVYRLLPLWISPVEWWSAYELGKYSFGIWDHLAKDEAFQSKVSYRDHCSLEMNPGKRPGLEEVPDWFQADPSWHVEEEVLRSPSALV
jgi:hypothetical protein